jgi:predicted small lipoprotein YifL
MPRQILLCAAALVALNGCGLGWPLSQHPDPNAAQAVQQAGPLVQDCQDRFQSWLGKTAVKWDTGPTITRTGDAVNIRLEAQPTAPEAIDAVQFSCDYDNGGQLSLAGPVP